MTIPAFVAALVTELDASLPDVQVTRSWPGPTAQENEMVFINDTIESDMQIATVKAGRKWYDETFTVTVEVWVASPGELLEDAAAAVQDRAYEITDTIRALLADEPKLADVRWGQITGRPLTLVPFSQGWACQGLVSVSVSTRLT